MNVFVGYDSREDEAFQVCKFSIEQRAKGPVKVFPLKHRELRQLGFFDRSWKVDGTGQYFDERDGRPFSTEFSHSRFLVPAYAKSLGIADGFVLFIDCDFLFLESIDDLFAMADDKYAVMVCKHSYVPQETKKMDGAIQSPYLRKNWSSLILWNLGHSLNANLTVDVVNRESGSFLHQFSWLPDDAIGALPLGWNWIADAVPANISPKAVHYSAGGPWFENYKDARYSKEWLDEQKKMRGELWKMS